MKPSDIIIGEEYIHINHPGNLYLGIGKAIYNKLEDDLPARFENKNLVIISGNNLGQFVFKPNDEMASQGFWNGFQLKNNPIQQPRDSRGRFARKA